MSALIRDAFFSAMFHLAPRMASVLLFILAGHLVGPAEAGTLGLAIAYLTVFTTIARGLDDLVVRQVSRKLDQAARYLGSFLFLRLGLSLVLYAVLVLMVTWLFDYSSYTTETILILSLSLIPDGLMYVAQSVLLGQRQFGAPAAILSGVSLFKLVGGGVAMFGGGGLRLVAWLWLAGSVLGMAVMLAVVVRRLACLPQATWLDERLLAQHRQAIVSFLLITLIATLEAQSDTIILSGFHGETQVGWYSAATTVTFSLILFSQAYRFAVYPLMTRYALQSSDKLARLYVQSMKYLGMFVVAVVAGIVLLAPQIVQLVFGAQFGPTVQVLRVLVLTLVFVFLNEPNSRVMLVHDRQDRLVLFLTGSALVNIVLNLVLAPSKGAVGAAVARVCSTGTLFTLNYLYVSRRIIRSNLGQMLAKSVFAAVVMVLLLWRIRTWPLPWTIGIGIVVYAAMLGLVRAIPADEMALIRQKIARWRGHVALHKAE